MYYLAKCGHHMSNGMASCTMGKQKFDAQEGGVQV